jgi:hypothetical protein
MRGKLTSLDEDLHVGSDDDGLLLLLLCRWILRGFK